MMVRATRTHDRFACLEGHRIAIHAANCWDTAAIDAARHYLTDDQIKTTAEKYHFDGQVILCTAFVERYGVTERIDAKAG